MTRQVLATVPYSDHFADRGAVERMIATMQRDGRLRPGERPQVDRDPTTHNIILYREVVE